MKRAALPLLALSFFIPTSALAARMAPATFNSAHTLVLEAPAEGNAYAAGFSAVIAAPIAGDLTALAGSLIVSGPVSGDALLGGGSIDVRAPIAGDLRAVGGSVDVEEPVTGDFVALAASVKSTAPASGSTFVIALTPSLLNGADGPVIVYGNNVTLAGAFAGGVSVYAGGSVTLLASTTIRGALTYESPENAVIPASVKVAGGVTHENASYLPGARTVRVLAFASIGIFFLIRVVSLLILAGLLAGIFPQLADAVVGRAHGNVRSVLLTALLGFAFFVAAPVFCVLLALTFVGLGLAILLGILYALVLLLAVVYAGITIGGLIALYLFKRENVAWSDGVLGMLVLSLVTLVPIVGLTILFLCVVFAVGSLLLLFFHVAFPREGETAHLL